MKNNNAEKINTNILTYLKLKSFGKFLFKNIGILLILLSINISPTIASPPDSSLLHEPLPPNNSYQVGEKLKFTMRYGWVTGATGTIELKEVDYEGKKLHHSAMSIKTVGLANVVYGVKDIYSSFFNPKTCRPEKAIRDCKEGSYKKYNEVTYHYEDSTVVSQLSGKIKVSPDIFDMVSSYYYARRMVFDNIQVGDTAQLTTYFDDEVFVLKLIFRGYDKVRISKGKIRCKKFTPMVQKGRVFDSNDDVTIWISDDKNHVPIRIKMSVMIGSFKVDLKDYSNLMHELKFD